MRERYTEDELLNFYDPENECTCGNPYGYTEAYVTTDDATGIPVVVYANSDNLASDPGAVQSILDLGDYTCNSSELARRPLAIASDMLENACVREDHCSDVGIDGWAVTLCANGYAPEDAGKRWVDPYLLLRVETSVPDSDCDFAEYHEACWNIMMRELVDFA